MGFVDAIKSFYGRYVDFKTRSTRSEYWWVVLFMLIGYIVLAIPVGSAVMAVVMSGAAESDPMALYGAFFSLSGLPIILFALANIIPGIALGVRRIHDFDRSGWLYLIVFFGGMIPLVGWLVSVGWLIINFFRGTAGPNQYGDDPLEPVYDTFN